MNEQQFIEKNRDSWQKIESYNGRAKSKGIGSLPKAQIREYTELYRLAGIHLAYARTHFSGSRTVDYLNQLMGVSHNTFYTKERSAASDVAAYFTRTFPVLVRKYKVYVAAATLTFILGAVFCYALALLDAQYLHYFLPEEQLAGMDFTTTRRDLDYAFFSSFIMTNNIRVSFVAFCGGFFAGLGTLFVLFQNGALIGALTNFVVTSGANMTNYWALILPHGVIELTAIFISGAAGLLIGKAILIPNELTRAHSFIRGAKEGAMLIPGITLMLVAAGLIEGFLTPLGVSPVLKLLFAAFSAVCLSVYFLLCGRGSGVR